MLFFIFHIKKCSVSSTQLGDYRFKRKNWLKAKMAKLFNSILSILVQVVNILFPIWCPSSINAFAAWPIFFSLSDNGISWGSYVPNYVQFLTAQHSYSETAVKSNVSVTQIMFFFFHFLQLTGSHNYQGLLPSTLRAAGTKDPVP